MKFKSSNQYILKNKIVSVVPFKKSYITSQFISFLNNKIINKHMMHSLDRRVRKKQTKKSTLRYFNERKKNNDYYFAIIKNYKKKLIGTITLRNLDKNSATIGFMIGMKKYFGSEYSRDSIRMVLDFSFKTLKLQKLHAGTNKNNISSNFCLMSNGFLLKKKTKKLFSFILLKRNFKKKIKYEISKLNSIS